ncbi:MAG: glycosyltransferase family 39 protein, partial [Acidimicrobiales bacterium]
HGTWLRAAQVVVGLALVSGLVLRFWTHSAMWLDEALTVDIARLPLHELPAYLSRDGAPPLYYVLLHFWMGAFGTAPTAVRSLSGVLSVATLPVAWLGARRFAGRTVAWIVVAVLATAPFSVYYATEARMYALVMLLTGCGFVAVDRALRQPRPGNLVAVAVSVAALLYSQYWALYLVAAFGLWLLFQARRGRPPWRVPARWLLGATIVGCLAFAPWVPTFLFQAAHTGTPWAKPPNFGAIINAVTGFTDNQATLSTAGSSQGRLLAILYFVLAGLALFGTARDRWHIDLDVRTRGRGRGPAFVVACTLVAAVTGGILSGSAFSPRYASVVFVPLILLVAYGCLTLADAKLRAAVVLVIVGAGLAVSVQNVWTQRTQAPSVASALAAHARAGDVVAFCPDQLGPAVYRLVPHGRYTALTYPRGSGPAYVDWVDYQHVAERSDPATFARRLEALAGSSHDVWIVSAPGYQGYGVKCGLLGADLSTTPGYGAHEWVAADPKRYYEPMTLIQYAPPPASPRAPHAAGGS